VPPRARVLLVLLATVSEVEQRGDGGVLAIAALERLARLGDLAVGHELLALPEELFSLHAGRLRVGVLDGRRLDGQQRNGRSYS